MFTSKSETIPTANDANGADVTAMVKTRHCRWRQRFGGTIFAAATPSQLPIANMDAQIPRNET